MIDRRPRVLRNGKLAESGNPERYIPSSTIEKLSGGTNRCSSALASAAADIPGGISAA